MNSIEEKCKAKGVRLTDQRRVIAKVMSDTKDHPDVDELHKRISEVDKKISIATVYRTVKLFEEAGILEKHDFTTGILALNHIGPYGYDLEDTIKDTYNNLCSSSDKFIYCRGMYVKDGKNPTFVLHVTYAAKHYYINLLLPKGIRPILLKKQINREAFGELILLNNRIKIPAEPYIYTSTFSVCINCSAPKGHPHKFSCN